MISRAGSPTVRRWQYRLAKRMMYKQREMTLENALEDAALNVMITNPSEDVREGTRAFREKRKPNFKGK